jgi:hypothetical protein
VYGSDIDFKEVFFSLSRKSQESQSSIFTSTKTNGRQVVLINQDFMVISHRSQLIRKILQKRKLELSKNNKESVKNSEG